MNGYLETIDSSEEMSGKASEAMEHYEAVEMMASERYLLDELTPDVRDAYEDHMFGCTECANDVRFGAAFVDRAKSEFQGMAPAPAPVCLPVKKTAEKRDWIAWTSFSWLRPAILVPAFACLLAIVGYQNLVVYPALEASATEPRLLPAATVLQGLTRGGLPVVYADRVTGSTLTVPLVQSASYVAYEFDFYDSKNKLVWTRTTGSNEIQDDMASIWLPSRVKQDSYKLAIFGLKATGDMTATGDKTPLQEQFFELQFKK